MHLHPNAYPLAPSRAPIDTGPCRNPGPMSPDSQIAALTVQVPWLTEQLQAQLRPVVPTKLVMAVPELATCWGRDPETIRRMIRRKELRTVRGHRPFGSSPFRSSSPCGLARLKDVQSVLLSEPQAVQSAWAV
jgi:hypothetical protein